MIALEPPADRILCKPLPAQTTTTFGLHLTDAAAERSNHRAEVIAVGAGQVYGNGVQVPHPLVPGDIVILAPSRGTDIEYDESTVISILAEQVLAREAP